MTPAITLLEKKGAEFKVHRYQHDPGCESYGGEAVEKLGVDENRVFKTLVAETEGGKLVVAIIPVGKMLDLKKLSKIVGCKKMKMAAASDVETATDYILGGVSPLGQKKRLATTLDVSATHHPSIFISGGRRGLEIELSSATLVKMTGGTVGSISR